ncbi:LysR family transcriptional regulator [Roseinatronobacter alkalisoli]|uniref:LysR family transcriptional regulator n=1 Tax=Roseinatronobacter alkalisoli TaxID=3028235 RepID=A0ABT5T7B2_9RHOB|nr:LysR family transcriptional regulator [Roseinatronobacter sp. HJB301]MDD7971002.1 LysR family transcriptional regulator [Roseinatronobacter sp. HJB301]
MNNIPIQWDHWRSFIAVAEQGSLSGAARMLGLTQPTVSRHIDLLEQATGTTLFLRSQQGLVLSDIGRQMLPEARAMAASAAALERSASAPIALTRGIVRLSASHVVGAEILPAVLAPLLAAHPGLEVELVLSNRNEDLLRREADLAVRMVRPAQTGLVARKIADVRLGLFAHARYLAARGTPRSVAELAGHVMIGPDRDSMALAGLADTGITRRMLRFRCDRESAQINAIRAGMGIGVLQAGIARVMPELRPVLADRLSFGLECWLALHRDLHSTARVQLVADHLAEHLPRALAA